MNDSVNFLEVEVKKLLNNLSGMGLDGKSELDLAEKEANIIRDILGKGSNNLNKSWQELAFLCYTANLSVRERIDTLVSGLDTFIRDARQNESVYQSALDKTINDVQSIVEKFGLEDGLG